MSAAKKKDWLSDILKTEGTYLASQKPQDTSLFTASPSFNHALGPKGFVYGRVPLFLGPEGAGKTLMALLTVAEMQRQDPEALTIFISSEYNFDPQWATLLGVDMERVIVRETNIPRQIFDWIAVDLRAKLQEGAPIKCIVIDTIKAIQGPKEQNLDNSESHIMGDMSQYLNKAFRLITPTIRDFRVLLILVQQVVQEMDQLKQKQGVKWGIPGGMALLHFADYFCLFERIERKDSKSFDESAKMINDNPMQIGHRVRVKINKNRTGSPFRVGEFDIEYKRGVVNQHAEIADLAINLGIVERPNNLTYQYGEIKVSGRDNFLNMVGQDEKLKAELYKKIMEIA